MHAMVHWRLNLPSCVSVRVCVWPSPRTLQHLHRCFAASGNFQTNICDANKSKAAACPTLEVCNPFLSLSLSPPGKHEERFSQEHSWSGFTPFPAEDSGSALIETGRQKKKKNKKVKKRKSGLDLRLQTSRVTETWNKVRWLFAGVRIWLPYVWGAPGREDLMKGSKTKNNNKKKNRSLRCRETLRI